MKMSALRGNVRQLLLRRPYFGNMILGGTIMIFADSAVQRIKKEKFDWKRTLTLTCWASLVVVPVRYRVIRFWDRTLGKRSAFWKGLATNQTLTCCLLPVFITSNSIVYSFINNQNPDFTAIKTKLQNDLVPTWAAMSMFWCPFHSLNFYFVPPVWRVISASGAQFLSGCFLSMMQFGHLEPVLSKIRGSATKIRNLRQHFLSDDSTQSHHFIVDVEKECQ